MKFLHEFKNGIDNGYWEINGEYLYNIYGGRHSYMPREDDEIVESTWDDIQWIMAKNAINNEYITGWIAPDGEFFGVAPEDHYLVGIYLNMTETEMEEKGYVKIFWSALSHNYGYYVNKYLTSAQEDVLISKGLKV